ncbi:hypothetical protein [Stanieria cyanosphaera]|uniref:hypothetical protein n=1 Tax=Stanieria cyanosphaera TaxID=102116 RepID=UPI0002FC142E|nr:hypothetical protein [Stanieria cyanosphaera]
MRGYSGANKYVADGPLYGAGAGSGGFNLGGARGSGTIGSAGYKGVGLQNGGLPNTVPTPNSTPSVQPNNFPLIPNLFEAAKELLQDIFGNDDEDFDSDPLKINPEPDNDDFFNPDEPDSWFDKQKELTEEINEENKKKEKEQNRDNNSDSCGWGDRDKYLPPTNSSQNNDNDDNNPDPQGSQNNDAPGDFHDSARPLTQEEALSQGLDIFNRQQISSDDIKGAFPPPGGSAGHARSKHNFSKDLQAEIINNPDRIFAGINDNGRQVTVFYKDHNVVITQNNDHTRVITAYGKDGIGRNAKGQPVPGKPVDLSKWSNNSNYVEIKGNQNTSESRPIILGE